MTSAVTFFQFWILRLPPPALLRDRATTQVSGEGLERLLPESSGLSGPQASALVLEIMYGFILGVGSAIDSAQASHFCVFVLSTSNLLQATLPSALPISHSTVNS